MYAWYYLRASNLLQDAKTGQSVESGPLPGRGLLSYYCEGTQVEGRAGDRRSLVEVKHGRPQYHAIDSPIATGLGPKHTRRRDAIGFPSVCRTLKNRNTPGADEEHFTRSFG